MEIGFRQLHVDSDDKLFQCRSIDLGMGSFLIDETVTEG